MQSKYAPQGMVVAPHHLATQSAIDILREGGTAIEAMVAAAATISVVYPHMNSIGGDSFWLIVPPHGDPIAIEASGTAGSLATEDFFKGYDKIPYLGPKAAITVAGAVGGWQEALNYVTENGYQRISVSRLLADAIRYAEEGVSVTQSYISNLEKFKDLNVSSEFRRIYLFDGNNPKVGDILYQKELGTTLRRLAENGLNSFYKGELARTIAEDMATVGMPITESDLQNFTAIRKTPLRLLLKQGEVFNLPPPTQGLVSLNILGVLEKLNIDGKNEGELVHATVEATKQAFEMRNDYITDPKYMKIDPNSLLTSQHLSKVASKISLDRAASVGQGKGPGDTIWMGAMDSKGFSVSFIQSVYHEFGSAVVLPKTGILWQNRGVSFTLEKDKLLTLQPGKKPFHTLNLATARLNDGRVMIFGTRGGDGQPQTQSAIFYRHVVQGLNLQAAVSAPRWLYGRIAGDAEDTLKIESRFSEETVNYLKERGHDVEILPEFSEKVGHAGALVRHPNGVMEGAFDPRCDGSASGF